MSSWVITWECITRVRSCQARLGTCSSEHDPRSLVIIDRSCIVHEPQSISEGVEYFQGCLMVRRFQIPKFYSWIWVWKENIGTSISDGLKSAVTIAPGTVDLDLLVFLSNMKCEIWQFSRCPRKNSKLVSDFEIWLVTMFNDQNLCRIWPAFTWNG